MGLIVPILLGLSPPEPGEPEPGHGSEETSVHPPGHLPLGAKLCQLSGTWGFFSVQPVASL